MPERSFLTGGDTRRSRGPRSQEASSPKWRVREQRKREADSGDFERVPPELKVTLVTGALKVKSNKPFDDPDCWSPLSIAVASVAS
jgi:hypothetical protein